MLPLQEVLNHLPQLAPLVPRQEPQLAEEQQSVGSSSQPEVEADGHGNLWLERGLMFLRLLGQVLALDVTTVLAEHQACHM